MRYHTLVSAVVAAACAAPLAAQSQPVETPQYWFESGQRVVQQAAHLKANHHRAKNVILFDGDGMGVSTVTAARILEGQLRGETGEENVLSFETLPYVALAKTYNTNQQTPDSAGTMTAMMTGVKTRAGVISVNQNAYLGDCASSRGNELVTFLEQAEMAGKALDMLSQNRKGYFLMVEAGRIDHGHHAGNAYRALTDTIELAEAVKVALSKVDPKETLIIVTADHSHVFTIAGYPTRGNPILGKVIGNDSRGEPKGDFERAADGMPYTTLSYANGRGFALFERGGDTRYAKPIAAGRVADLSAIDTEDEGFHQEALVPRGSETHSAEDVAIYAGGPGAWLLHGVQEQNVIYHVMARAAGLSGKARGHREARRHRDDND